MKTAPFSLNISATFLLIAALSLSAVNLALYLLDNQPVHEYEPEKAYSELNNRIIVLEQTKQKNILDISDIMEQLDYRDSNITSELNKKIDELKLEIENLNLPDYSFENSQNDSIYTDTMEVRTSIKKSFEEESQVSESSHELSLIQSSITESIYQNELENVELVDVVCKSQSCRVDLTLSDPEKSETILDKILNKINKDVDYQISGNNGEMSIFIRLNDS